MHLICAPLFSDARPGQGDGAPDHDRRGLLGVGRQRPPKVHQRCNRPAYLGELVQIDGSEHAWFEDRAPACTLRLCGRRHGPADAVAVRADSVDAGLFHRHPRPPRAPWQPLQRAGLICQSADQLVFMPRLVFVAEGQVIAEHVRCIRRSHGHGSTIYDWRHYLAVLQHKPGALHNGAPFALAS